LRAAREYEIGEWMSGKPLVHGFKLGRNVLIERRFRSQDRAAGEKLLAGRPGLADKTVICVVAFNAPWTIELLLGSAGRLANSAFIVFDNSNDREARGQIERICREADTAYLSLPANPERHPCRSHGLSMNWAYYNVIEPLRPRTFGFFDHDLIPIAPYDPAAALAGQPVYGVLNHSPWGWNLWAGFSLFDFARFSAFRPDFNHDVPRHLDTGGRNWRSVYRHLDRSRIRFAEFERIQLQDPMADRPSDAQLIDRALLHMSGVGHGVKRFTPARPEFYIDMFRRLAGGASLEEFRPPPASAA
jgi:hypothetical protein